MRLFLASFGLCGLISFLYLKEKSNWIAKISLFLFFSMSILSLAGCTYSVILNHTEGTATDLVDENQTPTTDIRPNITMPMIP